MFFRWRFISLWLIDSFQLLHFFLRRTKQINLNRLITNTRFARPRHHLNLLFFSKRALKYRCTSTFLRHRELIYNFKSGEVLFIELWFFLVVSVFYSESQWRLYTWGCILIAQRVLLGEMDWDAVNRILVHLDLGLSHCFYFVFLDIVSVIGLYLRVVELSNVLFKL